MTGQDRPARGWLGVSEVLFVHAVLLAILLWVVWESLVDLQPRDRALPLTVAVVVTGVLLYNLASRLWSGKKATARRERDAGESSATGETYGTFAEDALSARHAYAIIAFTAYVFLTPLLSIYLSTGLFVLVLSILLRVPWIATVAGLVLALAIPALFHFGLEMHLP